VRLEGIIATVDRFVYQHLKELSTQDLSSRDLLSNSKYREHLELLLLDMFKSKDKNATAEAIKAYYTSTDFKPDDYN
jgi:hypothetical protein